jgi:hypothetical protein
MKVDVKMDIEEIDCEDVELTVYGPYRVLW